jgi:hypothetical protein
MAMVWFPLRFATLPATKNRQSGWRLSGHIMVKFRSRASLPPPSWSDKKEPEVPSGGYARHVVRIRRVSFVVKPVTNVGPTPLLPEHTHDGSPDEIGSTRVGIDKLAEGLEIDVAA